MPNACHTMIKKNPTALFFDDTGNPLPHLARPEFGVQKLLNQACLRIFLNDRRIPVKAFADGVRDKAGDR